MYTLPQLIEEDIREIDAALQELIAQSDATAALVMDKAGFLIAQKGNTEQFDATTLGALAAGSFNANQAIAGIINEPNFSSVYQQGELFGLLVSNIDEYCLLLVLFKVGLSAGVVKYYAATAIKRVAEQIKKAKVRAPDAGFDLARMNVVDPSQLFKKP